MPDVVVPAKPAEKQASLLLGGAASMIACCFTHPLDLLKVRLQADQSRKGMRVSAAAVSIVRNEGVLALYNGLSASLLRQGTYSTVRFAVYEALKQRLAEKTGSSKIKVSHSIALSLVSGALGGIAGNPADLVNVRMQADGRLPAAQRRNYKHALDGLIRISRSDGASGLLQGIGPNVFRAMLMTAGQLASYDTFKQLLLRSSWFSDNLLTHFTASTMAGFVATVVCSPVDVTKTRVMNSPRGAFTNSFGAFAAIVKESGPRGLYKGFVPSFVRLGPQTVITFVVLEQLKRLTS